MSTIQEAVELLLSRRGSLLKRWRLSSMTTYAQLPGSAFEENGALARAADSTLDAILHHIQQESITDLELAENRLRLASSAHVKQAVTMWSSANTPDLRTVLGLIANLKTLVLKELRKQEMHDACYAAGIVAEILGNEIASATADAGQRPADGNRAGGACDSSEICGYFTNISHELRTPLMAVLGLSELLLEETYGPLEQKQTEALESIHDSGLNLLEGANNIVDLVHVVAGHYKPNIKPVDLEDELHKTVGLLSALASRRGVKLTHDSIGDGLEASVDCGIVRHIVYNALATVIRANPEGSEVRLSAHRQGSEVVVAVSEPGSAGSTDCGSVGVVPLYVALLGGTMEQLNGTDGSRILQIRLPSA